MLGEMRNKVCKLEKNVNILGSRIDELSKKWNDHMLLVFYD